MRMAEVSAKFELSQDTLRYYERIGLIPPVNRNNNGIREYNEDNLRWVEFIKCMRSAGLPIEALIEYVNLFQQGDCTLSARKDLLIEQREQLRLRIEEMVQTMGRLDSKIENYGQSLHETEKALSRS
ncbi:DNA-binding transcriptional regulator, MerR family [Paenibacillus catalpae]|uniref:DNA-binding transcriptional regulator, MerR family n=1 Tax=Paenibacillus catalpae TaxID=1045775 RepID=A0A1I1T371_9BACL|nr:MerR family transcriptional regulator [Paenibacillus catalpae]SFD53099.1 DNA-binding transcriptional regulator, MerR family [Paenibacillus catalpae]